MCAVLLLSIGLLAVVTATQASRDTQQRAIYLAAGRTIAQSKIDELRVAPTGSLLGMAGNSQSPSLPNGNSIQVSVSRYPDASQIHLYRATVTVNWSEARGTRRISYETLIVRK